MYHTCKAYFWKYIVQKCWHWLHSRISTCFGQTIRLAKSLKIHRSAPFVNLKNSRFNCKCKICTAVEWKHCRPAFMWAARKIDILRRHNGVFAKNQIRNRGEKLTCRCMGTFFTGADIFRGAKRDFLLNRSRIEQTKLNWGEERTRTRPLDERHPPYCAHYCRQNRDAHDHVNQLRPGTIYTVLDSHISIESANSIICQFYRHV